MGGAGAARAEYRKRLSRAESVVAACEAGHGRFANLRVALFLAGAAGLAAALLGYPFGWGVAASSASAFAASAFFHARLLRRRAQAESLVRHYRRGLLRLDDAWAAGTYGGEDLAPENHPYARDLNIFGEGSMFALLCTAQTRAGQGKLAAWLLTPAAPADIAERQEAVRSLAANLELRERLAWNGELTQRETHPEALAHWAAEPPRLQAPRWMALAFAVATAIVCTSLLVALVFDSVPPALIAAYVALFAVGLLINAYNFRRIGELEGGLSLVSAELPIMVAALQTLQTADFSAPLLLKLQQRLLSPDAARSLRRLQRTLDWLEAPRNQLLALVAITSLWRILAALRLEDWRRACGLHVRPWLDALGEIDALSALAAYAYEHTDDAWPEVAPGQANFAAEQLGHPLLPRAQCVRNDVRLGGGAARLWMLSGSNMSGKSTLLRAIGLNAVLAQLGAPVRAARLEMSPLAVFATLYIQDSLVSGRSRFYTEVLRLRALLHAPRELPWLYLLDEILHGTNSHDRAAGAEAIAVELMKADSIGLITTHDLSLTHMVERFGPLAENRHLSDSWSGEELVFDYALRPGVVQRSNAIALMRAAGIPVEERDRS